MTIAHDAFVSYSHSADRLLAPALERGLEKLATPLLKLRSMNVFRDETSLAASPGLWPNILEHLGGSTWFVLLASPASAASTWCKDELDWWLTNRSQDHVLIVLTDGEILWDRMANDFNWSRTTALSRAFAGRFSNEPLYVDLRWTKAVDSLSLAHPQFRSSVIDIAAPIRGVPKDELDSADVRQLNRNRRFVRAGVAAVCIAAALAIWQAIVATRQRQEAERQRDAAVAGRLASDARDARAQRQLDLPLLLAAASLRIAPSSQAANVLLSTYAAFRHPVTTLDAEGGARTLAASADGRLLAAGGDNGTVTVWDVESGRPIAPPFDAGGERINSIVFSPDSKLIAIATHVDVLMLWNVERRMPEGQPLRGHTGDVWSVAFRPDGKLLVSSGGDGSVLLWDLARRAVLEDLAGKAPDGSYYERLGVAFSSDGKTIAFTDPEGIALWDLAERKLEAPLGADPLRAPRCVAFSPDGSMLAAGDASGALVAWNLPSRERFILKGHDEPVVGLSFSADNKVLATASHDGVARLWDVDGAGQQIGEGLTVHRDLVTSVAFLGPSGGLATAGRDGRVVIWNNGRTHAIGRRIGGTDSLSSSAFTADGALLALGGENSVVFWDPVRDQPSGAALQPEGFVSRTDFCRDGATVVVTSGNLALTTWSVVNRSRIGEAFHLKSIDGFYGDHKVSPDCRTVALPIWGKGVALRDMTSRTAGAVLPQPGVVRGMAFSGNGQRFALASDPGTVTLWDVSNPPSSLGALNGPTPEIRSLAFSPDGQWLATHDREGIVRLWDAEQRTPSGDPLPVGNTNVSSLAFSPDASMLAVGGVDGEILLFDRATRSPLGPALRGHGGTVQRMEFNPVNGETLVSESQNTRVMLWDVSVKSWIERACRIANRAVTCAEWRQYFSGMKLTGQCPVVPTDCGV